jgi:sulfur relay protein TusB/DsrH
MLVLVKSGPDTAEGKRGISIARDMTANVVLIQNGVYFAIAEILEGFPGTIYILDEDCKLRGLRDDAIRQDVSKLDYDGLVDAITEEDKVVGMF